MSSSIWLLHLNTFIYRQTPKKNMLNTDVYISRKVVDKTVTESGKVKEEIFENYNDSNKYT